MKFLSRDLNFDYFLFSHTKIYTYRVTITLMMKNDIKFKYFFFFEKVKFKYLIALTNKTEIVISFFNDN